MKKQLIASLVGALILFVWQFLSWSMLNVHGSDMAYTPNQDKVLEVLSQNLEEGHYFLPNLPPGYTPEQDSAYRADNMGKPWATVSYHKAMDMNMGMSMFRAFVVDILAAFLLVWLLMKIPALDMKTALTSSLAVGGIAYLTIPYLNSIWFETGSVGYLIDLVAQWGLTGLWLGWYLGRK